MAKHPILTDEEVKKAKEKAKARHAAELKKQAEELLIAAEMDRLDVEAQIAEGDAANEMVTVSLDLPPFVDRLTIDGRSYMHGLNFTVPRHQAETMREMAQRAWQHQYREVEGKKMREWYQRPRETRINKDQVVTNAPQAA